MPWSEFLIVLYYPHYRQAAGATKKITVNDVYYLLSANWCNPRAHLETLRGPIRAAGATKEIALNSTS